METIIHPPRTGLQAFEMLPEGTYCQLINETLVMSPAPIYEHQSLSRDIAFAIHRKTLAHRLGEVLLAPFDVYLDNRNVFQPDIIFVSEERRNIIERKGCMGAPDLVIEIISGSTSTYDRSTKKDVYEKAGVKEYWMINPTSKRCEGFVLTNEKFEAIAPAKGSFHIQLIDMPFTF